jgi:hypothetical protein
MWVIVLLRTSNQNSEANQRVTFMVGTGDVVDRDRRKLRNRKDTGAERHEARAALHRKESPRSDRAPAAQA